jgi:hypothetical protein
MGLKLEDLLPTSDTSLGSGFLMADGPWPSTIDKQQKKHRIINRGVMAGTGI